MSARVVYGPNGQALPPGLGRAIQAAAGTEIGFRSGAGQRQALDGWNVGQTSADAYWLRDRDDFVAKTRDLLAREPWAQGGVERKLDMLVGAGWRPSIKPDPEILGISPEEAERLGRGLEGAYRTWADDPLCRCDLERTLNASWLMHMAVMEQVVTGDGLGVLRWKPGRGWKFRTALQVIDADRLSNPHGAPDTEYLRGGVEKDADGAPIAAHIRNSHPGDYMATTSPKAFDWTRIDWREKWGRPRVLHMFRKDRPGQTRGISKLVAALARFKQLQRYADSELANAVINALFAATITSSFDPTVAQEHLTSAAVAGVHDLRQGFYEQYNPTLAGARVQHLFPGDDLKFLTSAREAGSLAVFTETFLRSIASGLDISYEHISMDWSKVTYLSARASLLEIWRGIMKSRSLIEMMWATPILLAVSEDALDSGLVEMPNTAVGLYEAPAAWLRGRWIGPPRGWVDPVKEPTGALMQMALGSTTLEAVAADQGEDLDINVPQLGREVDLFKKHGLMPPALRDMLAVDQRFAQPEPAPAKT